MTWRGLGEAGGRDWRGRWAGLASVAPKSVRMHLQRRCQEGGPGVSSQLQVVGQTWCGSEEDLAAMVAIQGGDQVTSAGVWKGMNENEYLHNTVSNIIFLRNT